MSADEFLEIIKNLSMRAAQLREERDRWRGIAGENDRRAADLEAQLEARAVATVSSA